MSDNYKKMSINKLKNILTQKYNHDIDELNKMKKKQLIDLLQSHVRGA